MKDYTVNLTKEEAQKVLNALSLQPYLEVAQLIEKIVKQLQEHDKNKTE